jgi:transposase
VENRKYKSWTTRELNDLVALHVAGHSSKKIAQEMERTTHAINAKKEQLRTSGRIESSIKHWTNKQVKNAIEMHNIGHSHQEIGSAISRSRSSVSNMLKRLEKNGQLIKENTL